MLKDVISVIPCDPYRLQIRFEDGVEGIVALDEMVTFHGVFAPLRDPSEFRRVSVHPELGVVCWPNGADLDSDVLYARITGTPIGRTIPFKTR
jgi:Protein of unknown function (DUF2442)